MEQTNLTLTAIEGITVGHATNLNRSGQGCTVVLCPAGATAGVDVRGAAPGTRETEALRSRTFSRKSTRCLAHRW